MDQKIWEIRKPSEPTEKSEQNQINTLIYMMGDTANDIFQSFCMSEKDECKYDQVEAKLRTISPRRKT